MFSSNSSLSVIAAKFLSLCRFCQPLQSQLNSLRVPEGSILFFKKFTEEQPLPEDDDYAIWELAFAQSKGSGGAETVVQAYKRLLSDPEITVDGLGGTDLDPDRIPEVIPIRE